MEKARFPAFLFCRYLRLHRGWRGVGKNMEIGDIKENMEKLASKVQVAAKIAKEHLVTSVKKQDD